MTLIDLHTHTTASDGILSPSELIDRAIEEGCRAMAVTDHDTVGGLREALEHAAGKNIMLVPGIEFSIDFKGGSFHLVGLNVRYDDAVLLEVLRDLQEKRSTRVTRMVGDLLKHGINVREEEIIAESGGESLGRPHVARVLVRHGYARNMEDVFRHFLVPGKPGYVKKEKITLDEAITLIRHAGGIPLVAHPVSLDFKGFAAFETMLRDFIDRGIEGFEVYAALHDESQVEQFLSIARKYGLIVSGGSDFHGDKREKLGYYSPTRLIPPEIWPPLARRIGFPVSL